jgi:hypothetical protein
MKNLKLFLEYFGKPVGSGSQGVAVEYDGKIVKIIRSNVFTEKVVNFFRELYERHQSGKEVIDSLPMVYDFYEGEPSDDFLEWLNKHYPRGKFNKDWEKENMAYWVIDKAETVGHINKHGLSKEDITDKLNELIDWTWENMGYFLADLNSVNFGFRADGSFFVFDPNVYTKFPKNRENWKFGFHDDVSPTNEPGRSPLGKYHENIKLFLEYNSEVNQKIDNILDKIGKHGMSSLEPEEKALLDAQSKGKQEIDDAYDKLVNKLSQFTYKSDDGRFEFDFKEMKDYRYEADNGGIRYYGTMHLPDMTVGGHIIDGAIDGYIMVYEGGVVATNFEKQGYTDFDFVEGLEYEYDDFIQEIVAYIDEQ